MLHFIQELPKTSKEVTDCNDRCSFFSPLFFLKSYFGQRCQLHSVCVRPQVCSQVPVSEQPGHHIPPGLRWPHIYIIKMRPRQPDR